MVPGTDNKNLALFHEDLASSLGRLGLTGVERVVVYESGFGMRAARVAWMLEYAGLTNPMLLEGGFKTWRDSNYPVKRTRTAFEPAEFTIHPNPRILATVKQVRSMSASHRGTILDVRSKGEFEGTENRDCCPRSGRVPGSIWLEWTNLLDGQKRFRNPESVAKHLRSLGLHHNSEIAVYCHRGARAAAAFYALRSIGYTQARNYVASWQEWSSKKNLAIARGRTLS